MDAGFWNLDRKITHNFFQKLQCCTYLAVKVVKKKGKPDSNQETITACVKRAQKLSPDSKKYKDITYKIAKCMFLDLRPISICEDEGFREAILAAEPRYTIPSRVSYRYTILPELYNQCRGEVKNRIQRYRETSIYCIVWGDNGWMDQWLKPEYCCLHSTHNKWTQVDRKLL